MKPEDYIKEVYNNRKDEIQRDFSVKWKTMAGKGATRDDMQALYNEHIKIASKLNDDTQKLMTDLGDIDTLISNGLVDESSANEAKWRMLLGTEAEHAMFPRQESEKPMGQQYRNMLLYRDKLDSELAQFEMQEPGKRVKSRFKPWFMEEKTTAKLKKFVGYSGTGKNKKEVFRDATQEEIENYGLLKNERNRVESSMKVLLQKPDISNRLRKAVTTSDRKLGVSESIGKELELRQSKQQNVVAQEPKYQVNTKTGKRRVSYDGGKTWQILP